jgi:hypothetical protein
MMDARPQEPHTERAPRLVNEAAASDDVEIAHMPPKVPKSAAELGPVFNECP